jgi:hypothetical protein
MRAYELVSHYPEVVTCLTRASYRLTRVTKSAEIGCNEGEPFRKAARHLILMPIDICLQITMKKQ